MFYSVAGTVIGIVVGLLGILVALRPPKTSQTQKLIGFSVAALSIVAIFTEIHNKAEDDARQKRTEHQLAALQGTADEARTNERMLLEQNQQLQNSNAHLEVQLQELVQKPGAYEAAQAATLREDISRQLEAVRKYVAERQKQSPSVTEHPGRPGYSEREAAYQTQTAVIYSQRLCSTTAALLTRAFQMHLTTERSDITCSAWVASAGTLEGIDELASLYQRLPGK